MSRGNWCCSSFRTICLRKGIYLKIENIHIKGTFGQGGVLHLFKTIYFWLQVIQKLLQERHFHLIHCQDLNTLLPGILVGKFLRRPIIFDSHYPYPQMLEAISGSLFVKCLSIFERALCHIVDRIITVNHVMYKRFKRMKF